MHTEERSPSLDPHYELKNIKSPSTAQRSQFSSSDKMEPEVQDFNFTYDMMSLNKMMSKSSLEEKENEKHITDRFIPIRKTVSMKAQSFSQDHNHNQEKVTKRGQEINQQKLTLDQMYKMLILQPTQEKVLNFGDQPQKAKSSIDCVFKNPTDKFLEGNKIKKKKGSQYRKISKTPFKVLDAPNLQDDFYLNLLEWSSQNILSVALDTSLYMWNANNNKVLRFCDIAPSNITSLAWNNSGTQVGVGTSQGVVDIWDLGKSTKIQTLEGHQSRVSSIAWSSNLIATGSRDRKILLRDPRQSSQHIVSTLQSHNQQVCGLKWSFDGHTLASGGNDNKLCIWNVHSQYPVYKFNQHSAAVKGLAWSPHNHGILASGGGSADRTIKFWNTMDGTLQDSIDTGSQVCNLLFSKTTKELVSTHGYSNNQIIIWKYPTLQKVSTLSGHSSRVLFLSMNPSGQTIVTGAGDETLRFWNVFPQQEKPKIRPNNLSTIELR